MAGVGTLDTNVRGLVVRHFNKRSANEHLRFRRVETRDHAADLLRRFLVGADDDVVRHRVHGNIRRAHRAVVVVARRTGAAGAITTSTAAKTTEAAKAAETAAAAEALLRVEFKRGAQ